MLKTAFVSWTKEKSKLFFFYEHTSHINKRFSQHDIFRCFSLQDTPVSQLVDRKIQSLLVQTVDV
jgi:hypothetical protein